MVQLFFDGTGNNRAIDTPLRKFSNVTRLWFGHAEDLPLINRFYYEGIGTPLDASDPALIHRIRDSEMLGGGIGLGGDVRLQKAEKEFGEALKRNHRVTRIDVAVFGFSRGATLARAFVNKLLEKCEHRDGVPHWPCATALDGKAVPLHFRFLGIFDTVESVGVPAHNLTGMLMNVPDEVEKCLHLVAGHEIRTAFPLTRLGKASAAHREFVYPGVHSDVGGGYRPAQPGKQGKPDEPGEQGRSDMLARIPLNRMRLEAALAGVPFTPPSLLTNDVAKLFGYDEAVKTAFDEYNHAVDIGGTLREQVAAHMRLYYGWLKARYQTKPCDVYKGVCGANPESDADLKRIEGSYTTIAAQLDSFNWRTYMEALAKTDPHEWHERARIGGVPPRLSHDEEAYYAAWLNPPVLSESLMRFFDTYVHDSRAGFQSAIGKGLYLSPRLIIEPSGGPRSPDATKPTTRIPVASSTEGVDTYAAA
ncbi:T6SS phospholipase effector Tle1-like catalytic domain-containing protein [Paraburkholderia aspalathi]|uniref:T6SS phospholipase effector Tle1-like catalytic domain-containing protein n=1 Tax=Paraburkholderia aspalathi TaxID=1324617 RepID=UPI0038BE18B6